MYKGTCRADNVPRGRSPLCFGCQAGLEGNLKSQISNLSGNILTYAVPIDQTGVDLDLDRGLPGVFHQADEPSCRRLAHVLLRNVDCGQGRIDDRAHRHVVEPDDGDILRDTVSVLHQRLCGSHCDQVIVRKVAGSELIAIPDQLRHIGESSIYGRRQQVGDALGGGHAGGADRFVEPGGTLRKVADLVSGLEVPGLFPAGAYQVARRKVSALHIVDQHAVAGHCVKIRVQQDQGNGKVEERL